MAETKARFLANLIGATSADNDFTLPNVAISGTNDKVLTSGGDGTVTWETTLSVPTITSVTTPASDNSINENDNVVMTVSGNNFANTGMTAKLVDASNETSVVTGHDVSDLSINFTSSTTISVTTRASTANISQSNVKLVITKSGLSATSASIGVSPDPTITTLSDPHATLLDNLGSGENVGSAISASASDGASITYSISGATSNGNTYIINSSSGQITTPSARIADVSSGSSYNETPVVTATAGGDSTRTATINVPLVINKYYAQLFAGKIYDGQGAAYYVQFDETGDFAPDLVWVKNREEDQHHVLFDTLRGATWRLIPNLTSGQDQQSQYLTDFEADGFDVGHPNNAMNKSGIGYVAWGWKAGGQPSGFGKKKVNGSESNITEATTSSGDGDYYNLKSHNDSTYGMKQSINSLEGFSITKYSLGGTSGYGWFKHGFTGDPDFVIHKRIDDTYNWDTWHSSLRSAGNWGSDMIVWLNESNSLSDMSSNNRQNVFRDSTGSDGFPQNDGKIYIDKASAYGGDANDEFICYAWQAKSGKSAFGTFDGNDTTDVTVYTTDDGTSSGSNGFQPRFVMIKCVGGSGHWIMWDSFRGFGTNAHYFKANDNIAEVTVASRGCTVTSNSFTPHHYHTQNTNKYIYMAFA